MLTDENSKSIERVQKSALLIICYENALEKTKLERLDQRRIKMSLSFAKKAVKHPQHIKKKQINDCHEVVFTFILLLFYVPLKVNTP